MPIYDEPKNDTERLINFVEGFNMLLKSNLELEEEKSELLKENKKLKTTIVELGYGNILND